MCEKLFRSNVSSSTHELKNVTMSPIVHAVLKNFIGIECFPSLNNHMFECHPLENHLILLIKSIAEKYLQVRFYYAAREFTAHLKGKMSKISRQNGNKFTIFCGL
jgi:hypothetical protein